MNYMMEHLKRPFSPWITRCLVAVAAAVSMQAAAQTPIWSEEFDTGSVPDPSIWSYDIGTGNWGWGNGELQSYTSNTNNVRVEGGNLIITAKRSGNSFTSGRIKTLNKLTFKYGTVEARIKTPDLANGLWPAFWTLGNNNPSVGWPACGEIDIMEMGHEEAISGGVVNRYVGSHLHWGTIVNGGWPNWGREITRPTDINDTFVVYRMEWTPASIKTYIDGVLIQSDTSNIYGNSAFNAPHFLILNLAVGGTLPGDLFNASDITALPNSGDSAEYVIDYIRLYDNGYTVLGGSGAPNIPPEFTEDPIIRPNALEGSLYLRTIAGSATDADGDDLTFSKVSGPDWLNVGGNGVLSGVPDRPDVGTNSWTVMVDDGNGGTNTAILEVTVDKLNDPPVFNENPIIKPNALEGTGYIKSIAGSASDVDPGDTLTFSKDSGPGWLNVTGTGVISGVPGSTDVGLNSWTVEVTDGTNAPVSATLEITVDSIAGSPALTIQVSGSDLEILWPSPSSGYNLYGTDHLNPPVTWTTVTNTPVAEGDDWMVTIPIVEAPQFFQLQNP